MKIFVTAGIGSGSTTMAAFDNALEIAGIANFNLIKLSSIIPPKSEILIEKYLPKNPNVEFGNKLYTVLADSRSSDPQETIGSGIGWFQWGDGRGVFAEHHEIFKKISEAEAENRIKDNLIKTVSNLCEFRKIPFEPSEIKTVIKAKEISSPSCTLVAAVYKSENWE